MSSPAIAGTEQHAISVLPPEVLSRIFKCLSVNERKAVKLVCKFWLKSCNISSLLNDEVLSCLGIYQLSDIYELLGKSERQCLNLRFENVRFHDGVSFWRNNGPRVRSIAFKDCQFFNGILEEIVICCETLGHLSFTYTANFQYVVQDINSLPPISDLEKVSAKGIVRGNLSSLEIYIINSNWMQLSDYTMQQLFLIFPKVKILKITSDFSPVQDFHLDLSELCNRNHVTMAPVLNYLITSREQIEKLKLCFPSAEFSPNDLRCILETVSSLNKLTELYIATRKAVKIEDIGTVFYSKQLKSLELRLDMDPNELTTFLSLLLHSNSSLQYLNILQPYTDFLVHKPFYEKLILSGLKSFSVTAAGVCMLDPDSFGPFLATQNSFSVLPSMSATITSKYSPENISFLRFYLGLRHLKVDDIPYDSLQLLLKYQKKLRSLEIFTELWFEQIDIEPDDLSFNQLTDIEYLQLTSQAVGGYFFSTLSPDPILAKLKYLRIKTANIYDELFPSRLLRSADVMPFLEGLYLYVDNGLFDISFDVIVELCTKLSRLRYLYFKGYWLVDDGVLTDDHYCKLFSICPSLRAVVHFGSTVITHFFDTINKKVVLKQDEYLYSLGRPRIGDCVVSWLEF